ncbi:Phytoene synthase [Tepidimonas thermarum]|uniref:Phytoene synthase n=1 Tax=Tepidimonas thermarum TaxID=335431 RepID=A0A554WZR6_9BURK|nr:squalene synthase HpnC [Tepidimonas thermarum]TSE29071.1 Phytoene synthase [Tepidimonas thermarum]
MSLARRVDHYENFPVASIVCPGRWRPAVVALYHFARTADDLADEGDTAAEARLAALAALRHAVQDLWHARGEPDTVPAAWRPMLAALDAARRAHDLPLSPLEALLDAFEQDVRWSAAGRRYRDEAELLDYCARSANPIGRLLLHLAGVRDAQALRESDAICTALQLINLWQDLGQDLARGRCYVTDAARRRHGLALEADLRTVPESALAPLVLEGCQLARQHLQQGWALPGRLGARLGWELRLTLQGGLRVLERIEALHGHTRTHRPRLGGRDALVILGRALRHRAARVPATTPMRATKVPQ